MSQAFYTSMALPLTTSMWEDRVTVIVPTELKHKDAMGLETMLVSEIEYHKVTLFCKLVSHNLYVQTVSLIKLQNFLRFSSRGPGESFGHSF